MIHAETRHRAVSPEFRHSQRTYVWFTGGFSPGEHHELYPQQSVRDRSVSFRRFILLLFLLVGTTTGALARVPGTAVDDFNSFADVRVVYNVESSRNGRFISQVMLTNMTSEPIDNWVMSFQMDALITGIEHVTWSRFGTIYDIQGSGWTKRIEPGGIVWFTINGLLDGYNVGVETPRDCSFNNISCTIEGAPTPEIVVVGAQDLKFSAWIESEGVSLYTGHIIIQNPTDYPVENWRMTFSTSSLIIEINHVDWSRSASSYTVSGTGWTSTIPAKGFLWFDFKGVHSGAAELPSACSFGGVACEFLEPDRLVETCCDMEVRVEVYCFDDNTFRAVFFIENPDVKHLEFWKLRFTWTANVTKMDGVKWTRSGSNFTVIGEGSKKRILAGRDVWFEATGTYTDVVEPPENCSINGVTCTIESTGTDTIEEEPEEEEPEPPAPPDPGPDPKPGSPTCETGGAETSLLPDIEFTFLSVTTSAPLRYIGLVEISNNTDGLILGWRLGFTLLNGMTVTRFWNGLMTTSGGGYEVVNTANNECIAPGKTVSFGFEGAHNGNFDDPMGCQFDTRSCLFQRQFTVTTEVDPEVLPDNFELGSVYPNPFNPVASFDVSVGKTQQVLIELWDVQGRKAGTVFRGMATAGFPVRIQLSGEGLASGLYLLRMTGSLGLAATRSVVFQK